MPITLSQVVPWGRSLDEYRLMFDLSDQDLAGSILGCGDGPASFNDELTAGGRSVVSCDPLYAFSGDEIARRIDETYETIISQLGRRPEGFVWTRFRDPDDLGRHRLRTMQRFLADFEEGKGAGRYRVESLPALSFGTNEFDLAVCSHLLFLYSEQFSLEFHRASIQELARVAREVRIFPLLTLEGKRSPHVEALRWELPRAGLHVEVRAVPYEFQRGGNEMMRVLRHPAPHAGSDEFGG
jgi:hypothetical protein